MYAKLKVSLSHFKLQRFSIGPGGTHDLLYEPWVGFSRSEERGPSICYEVELYDSGHSDELLKQ